MVLIFQIRNSMIQLTLFTCVWQGGVNLFTDYPDDAPGERIFKSGRAGFVGWLGFGGSVIQWRPDLRVGFAYACTLLTWWDMANTKVQQSPVFLFIKTTFPSIFRIRIQLDLWIRIRTGNLDPDPGKHK
jgi:hypothetical protein